MEIEKQTIIDSQGNALAELQATGQENDWYAGKLLTQQFPAKLRQALAWYDEVVENQMLSYLDQATDAVQTFGLRVRLANGAIRPVFSFHVNKDNEVSFRTSPVPPPTWLSENASAGNRS